MDELLPKGIWGEIVGLGDVSKTDQPDDVSVLGATEPATTQAEGALSLLSKKTAKPLVLPKKPELATQTETDEAVDSELFFRSLSAGRPEDLSRVCGLDQVESVVALAKVTPEIDAAVAKKFGNMSDVLARLKAYAEKKNRPGVAALVSRMIQVHQEAA